MILAPFTVAARALPRSVSCPDWLSLRTDRPSRHAETSCTAYQFGAPRQITRIQAIYPVAETATALLHRERMTRPIRLHVPNVAAHVMSRGNNKQCIFLEDGDYEMYLELLAHTLTRFAVRCHAFCLMWNHLHLLLTPTTFPISRMMQQLNSRYCQWFNKRHRRVGHMLQGRYAGLLLEGPVHFLNALRYLALNPVVARRVTHPADWPWSSYRAALGMTPLPSFLDLRDVCAAFDAKDVAEARDRFDMFVMSGEPVGEFWGRLVVGSEGLERRIGSMLEPHRENHEFTYAERFATRPALAKLLQEANEGPRRDRAVHEAFCRHAYTLKEIGDALGRHPSTIWRWVQRANSRWVIE